MLGELAEPGPRHVEDHQRDALRGEHVEQLDPRFRALLGIGVERDLDPRVIEQDRVMGDVADISDDLATR